MDAKRQNKLLKLAIGRLQNELENKDNGTKTVEAIEAEEAHHKAKIFLTENSNQQPADLHRSMVENTTTTAPNSVFETGLSKFASQ